MDDDLSGFSDEDCNAIWSRIAKQPYDWPMKPKTKVRLAKLLGEPDSSPRLQHICRPGSARLLREAVGPLLVSEDISRREEAARWIISDWGGIRRGDAVITKWLVSLGDFERSRVTQFVTDIGTKRIASWSKLLSFRDPRTYAIYDARTAFSLNAALHLSGRTPIFFKPAGRNGTVESAAKATVRAYGRGTAGYSSYLSLLNRFVGLGLAGDLLQAEETVFAAAPAMALLVQVKTPVDRAHEPPVQGEISKMPLQASRVLADSAFDQLKPSQKDIVLELIPDMLGGQNSRSPSAVERAMKKIAIAAELELTPALRASLIAYLKNGRK